MNIWTLVFQEIRHRKWNFVLGVLSVSVAVTCLVGSWTLLDANEIQTDVFLAKKDVELQTSIKKREDEVKKAGKALEDQMRKITKEMGFNVLIISAEQDLNELPKSGTLSTTMPEEYVSKLANSKIMTVNHLLPVLRHRENDWLGPKKKQTVLVIGTRGEVPILHRDPKKPLKGGELVRPGTVVLGHLVRQNQQLKIGETIKILGRELTVAKHYKSRGTADDITIWMNLKELQDLKGQENLIHGILALECNCSSIDRVAEIRKEIIGVLPGTQVLEKGSRPALARAESRKAAKKVAVQSLKDEKKNGTALLQKEKVSRDNLKTQQKTFANILVPLAIVGAAIWMIFLAYGNARQRSAEIGILRAIGLQAKQLMLLFLGKALLIGSLGAIIGYAVGFCFGVVGSGWSLPESMTESPITGSQLFVPQVLLLAVGMSLLLSAIASWLPAVFVARQDPATVLQGE